MHKPARWLGIAFVLACNSLPMGWGRQGHQIVAKIAEMRLTPVARERVAELLGDKSMADVASWPDEIRRDRPETGPWHYVDIPDDAETFDETRDGQNGNNVIDKINDFAGKAADESLPVEQRAEALKFLIHFCGDITQPLHCTERNHDKGGNTRLVFLLDQSKASNLHGVWDYGILEHAMGNTPINVYAAALNVRISRQQSREWGGGTPEDWANESHKLAHEVTYAGVPVDGPPPKLNEEYVARATDVINMQLQKGGLRLARTLNRVFHSPATRPVTYESATTRASTVAVTTHPVRATTRTAVSAP